MTSVTQKLIRVGHSPDPDDAFMFYALAKGKIPMRGFRVEHVIEDIESLNQRALRGELEVTAISCHAYAYLAERYAVMRSGASVGDQYGPILVAKNKEGVVPLKEEGPLLPPDFFRGKKIAVPGRLTTAYLVLQLFEKKFEAVFVPFDKIFEAVQNGAADFGLVIHEGQIIFNEKGLVKVLDLGRWWHEKTALPLPLGVDVIRLDLGAEDILAFSILFKESIQYALEHREEALDYALQYGRGIRRNLGDQFVGMYVNAYTVDLGEKGIAGFEALLAEGFRSGILSRKITPKFVPSQRLKTDKPLKIS